MKVREMMRGIAWGQRLGWEFYPVHILATRYGGITEFQRAYCGVHVLRVDRRGVKDSPVCKRCLRATEKYA